MCILFLFGVLIWFADELRRSVEVAFAAVHGDIQRLSSEQKQTDERVTKLQTDMVCVSVLLLICVLQPCRCW